MKKIMKSLIAGLAVLAMQGVASADIVFQDNFDNDGLTNAGGTGGDLVTFFTGGLVTDNGNLTGPTTGHNSRGNFLTSSSFDLTGGFTLTASFDTITGASVSGVATRAAIGLVPSTTAQLREATVFQQEDTISVNLIQPPTSTTGVDALGLFLDGANIDGSLAVDGVAGFEDVVITVAANGLDYSYSIGTASVSGTFGTAFDFTQQYRVEGIFQDAETVGVYESITLEVATTAVPEPTSIALLGLGALGLVTRRRK